jgi:hypothetical protein
MGYNLSSFSRKKLYAKPFLKFVFQCCENESTHIGLFPYFEIFEHEHIVTKQLSYLE